MKFSNGSPLTAKSGTRGSSTLGGRAAKIAESIPWRDMGVMNLCDRSGECGCNIGGKFPAEVPGWRERVPMD